jgi:hypothetical protein
MADRVMTVLLNDSTWSSVPGYQVVQFIRNQSVPSLDLNNDGEMWYQRLVTVRVTMP